MSYTFHFNITLGFKRKNTLFHCKSFPQFVKVSIAFQEKRKIVFGNQKIIRLPLHQPTRLKNTDQLQK